MKRCNNSAATALAISASLFLAACETPAIATRAPAGAATILRGVPVVENSASAPCWQQKQIAAQRSYIESAVSGKKRRYHAACAETKPDAKAPAEPKTS